jgi:hypothetical protein
MTESRSSVESDDLDHQSGHPDHPSFQGFSYRFSGVKSYCFFLIVSPFNSILCAV